MRSMIPSGGKKGSVNSPNMIGCQDYTRYYALDVELHNVGESMRILAAKQTVNEEFYVFALSPLKPSSATVVEVWIETVLTIKDGSNSRRETKAHEISAKILFAFDSELADEVIVELCHPISDKIHHF